MTGAPVGEAGVIVIGWWPLLLSTGFVVFVGMLSLWLSLGIEKSLAIATLRTFLQLAALGLVLRWVFSIDSAWVVLGILLVMMVAAAQTIVSRAPDAPPGIFTSSLRHDAAHRLHGDLRGHGPDRAGRTVVPAEVRDPHRGHGPRQFDERRRAGARAHVCRPRLAQRRSAGAHRARRERVGGGRRLGARVDSRGTDPDHQLDGRGGARVHPGHDDGPDPRRSRSGGSDRLPDRGHADGLGRDRAGLCDGRAALVPASIHRRWRLPREGMPRGRGERAHPSRTTTPSSWRPCARPRVARLRRPCAPSAPRSPHRRSADSRSQRRVRRSRFVRPRAPTPGPLSYEAGVSATCERGVRAIPRSDQAGTAQIRSSSTSGSSPR